MTDSRMFMRKGEKITLFEESTKVKKTFTIIGKDGAGSSSVSYIASCGKKTGRLKEFYPFGSKAELSLLERKKDNQLSNRNLTQEALDTYSVMLEEYIESYHILEDAVKKAEKGNNSFGTFIPSFEIYRGFDEELNIPSGAYIWTIDNNGDFETFESYLAKVHKSVHKNPAKAMYVILKTLYNLTECVKTLHTAGLIHSDIKPENFGFFIRDGRCLTEQVRLFDVNSIYSVYTKFPAFSGTAGYCAPEVHKGKITNQSDLYSIGAVLFNAIALSDEIEGGLYSDKLYSRIDEVVASSKLLCASPVTSSVRFRLAIGEILKKCLASQLRNRVDNCDELKAALQKACVLLLPARYNDSLDLGSELKIIDKELEQFDEADSLFSFQSLLFCHPLYENSDDTIRVLVAGFGIYGQQFLDVCLQSGQIVGKKLEVTVVTCDKEIYKEEYLQRRPALTDFFSVDGRGDTSDTNYGKITFVTPDEFFVSKSDKTKFSAGFRKTDSEHNKQLAKKLMCTGKRAGFVFVSLGDEKTNLMVAKACASVAEEGDFKCNVACVCSDGKKRKGILPVNVTAKAEENINFGEIDRMAFNAHLSWNSPLKLNINIKKARQEFMEEYNRNASVACVMSVKNILHACSVELSELTAENMEEAARRYNSFIKNNKEIYAQLVCCEHRRWVVEKITAGWTCREDLTACLEENINDKKKKIHPCIVKSRADFNLEKFYKNIATGKWFKAKWNEPCEEDTQLDALDTVSLKLHRVFFEAAGKVKSSFSLSGEETARIQHIISDKKEIVIPFNDWMLCMKRLWGMDQTQAKFYEGYKDIFIESLDSLKKSERDDVLRYVKIIDSKIKPVLLAYRMRDYKASDKELINALPFILTNRLDRELFVPFMTGDNTDIFNNVATATVVNPEYVTYGVYLQNSAQVNEVFTVATNIISYMDKKDIKSRIRFLLIFTQDDVKLKQLTEDLCRKLKELSSRVRQVTLLPVSCEAEVCEVVSSRVSASAYENNNAYLSALLVGAGFYLCRPHYSFDSSRKKFSLAKDCEWLTYIKSGQFITVSDMLSFKNSTGIMDTLPEYSEYKWLWNYYKGASYAWKDMCAVLSKHTESNDLISAFYVNTDLTDSRTLEFIIPDSLRDSYNYVVSFLRDEAKIIGTDSKVEYKTTESCKVTIIVGLNNIDSVRKLFANPYIMVNRRNISIVKKPRKIEIRLNNLIVHKLDMEDFPDYSEKKKRIADTLRALYKEGFIYNLKITDNQVFSFVYSTYQAKQLMTSAGRILEIYVYHKLQSSNFDDVVSGFEINWEDTDIKSEFDCIVTSGFRCVMIECKAQDKLSQDYYFKLSCLSKQFGINAIPILIADTHEDSDKDNSVNEAQRMRGRMMGVITIYDRDEISNIDMTLKRIMKGTYGT